MKIKCSVIKVGYGKTKTGKDFAVVEGISADIGIWKCFTSVESGKQAEDCRDYADNTYMLLEPYTDKDYRVNARVVGFTID